MSTSCCQVLLSPTGGTSAPDIPKEQQAIDRHIIDLAEVLLDREARSGTVLHWLIKNMQIQIPKR